MASSPRPTIPPGFVGVEVVASLISSGTERTKADFASRSLVGKARARPDAVKQVIDSVRARGLKETWATVKSRMDASEALGYSCSGVVTTHGRGHGLVPVGSRVACAGTGYAVHAEQISVPAMLVMPLPDNVDHESAAFVALGGIALQAIRQSQVEPGGAIGVCGLGLVGQLVCRLGVALGLDVVGFDPVPARASLARSAQARTTASESEFIDVCLDQGKGSGVDAVVVAAATQDDGPLVLAGKVTRDRGTVVVVGDVGTGFPRDLYYEKELQLRLSRSYGPGRYDRSYEEDGVDYPVGYVRWTERRNMELFLRLLGQGRLEVKSLISHRYGIDEAPTAYEVLQSDPSALAILLNYDSQPQKTVELSPSRDLQARRKPGYPVRLAAVGSGNFATRVLFPLLRDSKRAELVAIASERGLSAMDAKERFGFESAFDSPEQAAGQQDIDALFVSTRHDSHADLVLMGLERGLAVYTEKPLALNWDEFDSVVSHANRFPQPLWVGFNRRFAPATRGLIRAFQGTSAPRNVTIRVNAGPLPADHWLRDPVRGGGRLIGEGCHFIDLALALIDSRPLRVMASGLDPLGNEGFSIQLAFEDGSTATIDYASGGDPSVGKERIELFGGGATGVIDDFKTWLISKQGKSRKAGGRKQEKGHAEELDLFLGAVADGQDPALLQAFLLSSAAVLAAADSLNSAEPMKIPEIGVD